MTSYTDPLTCPNCNNKKARDIRYGSLELDHLQILKDLVNNSGLTHDQIGQIAFNMLYEEEGYYHE